MANINNINSGIDYSVFFGGSSSNSSTGKVSGTAAGDNDVVKLLVLDNNAGTLENGSNIH